jgi:hypothetical protein
MASISSGDFSKGSRNLIIATFYIVIGMALLAMCFELIQDQIVNKVKHLSQLLGIHTEEDEQEKKENEDKDEVEVINDNEKNENQVVPKSALSTYDENLEIHDVENNQNDYIGYELTTKSALSKKSQIFETETEHTNPTKLLVRSASTKKERSKERNNSESKC